jgi:hypothetical protein
MQVLMRSHRWSLCPKAGKLWIWTNASPSTFHIVPISPLEFMLVRISYKSSGWEAVWNRKKHGRSERRYALNFLRCPNQSFQGTCRGSSNIYDTKFHLSRSRTFVILSAGIHRQSIDLSPVHYHALLQKDRTFHLIAFARERRRKKEGERRR